MSQRPLLGRLARLPIVRERRQQWAYEDSIFSNKQEENSCYERFRRDRLNTLFGRPWDGLRRWKGWGHILGEIKKL